MFRFNFDNLSKILYINYVNPIFQTWDFKTIKHLRKYFGDYTSSSTPFGGRNTYYTERSAFLPKNYKKMIGVQGKRGGSYYIQNRITYKTGVNKIKMVPEFPNTEDVLHRVRPKKN